MIFSTKSILTVILSVTLLCSGCARMNNGQAGAGAVTGAVLGQIIGRSTEATLIGASIGTGIGYMIGNEFDKYDQQQISRTLETRPSGQTSAWTNPDSGNRYNITPQKPYTAGSKICRKAEIAAIIDGKQEITTSTACRDQSGRWQLQG